MTDTNVTPAPQASVGNTGPAPLIVESEAPKPVLEQSLDENIAAFFDYSMSDPMEGVGQQETPAESAQPNPEPQPVAQPVVQPETPTPPTSNVEPATGGQTEGGAPEVDQDLIAAVMLGGLPSGAAPQPTQDRAETTPQNPEPSAESVYQPLVPKRGMIPPQVLDTIFNSDDPLQREDALTNLLTSWGNAILQMSEDRVREFHMPRIVQTSQAVQLQEQQVRAIQEDFYSGENAPLRKVPQLVERVTNAYAQKNPNARYGPEMKQSIATATRELAKRLGIALEGPAPAPATPQQPFIAGSARPNGTGDIPKYDPTDPATVLDLADAGFSL